jgi:hypothetical protein
MAVGPENPDRPGGTFLTGGGMKSGVRKSFYERGLQVTKNL